MTDKKPEIDERTDGQSVRETDRQTDHHVET